MSGVEYFTKMHEDFGGKIYQSQVNVVWQYSTLNAPIAKKVICFFSAAEMFMKPL